MTTRRLRLLLCLLLPLAFLLAACGDDDEGLDSGGGDGGGETTDPEVADTEFDDGTTMAELSEAGAIKIGVKYDQPGLGAVSLDSEEPEGFDIEIGKLVAAQLGIEPDGIEFIETVSANRETFIENGTVDIVVATYTINDERKEVIDFAGPYYVAGQDLLVGADDDSINGPDDLAGKRVCAASGSTPIERIREDYPDAEPVEFDTYTECVDQLLAGQIDAVSTDDIILAGYAADPQYEGEFRLVGETFSDEPYGIGLEKGDDEFRSFLNDTLEESYEDGTWESSFDATLGASGVEAPEPPEVDRY
ncbi:glutamate ABC transporter substrate-binding protein [Iamia sp.]|uniref:glutamate ABC transporter substrate-binding protein n=1 Tax=Iamia sp. TaxID=2722710 RepID=UPI002B67601C|nr:glutamate ABC transporter substrate-binding protein [Iamia sp.]HXH58413.1 glutamate ABC transporter substrate-binding protein [Iamia sp.]